MKDLVALVMLKEGSLIRCCLRFESTESNRLETGFGGVCSLLSFCGAGFSTSWDYFIGDLSALKLCFLGSGCTVVVKNFDF